MSVSLGSSSPSPVAAPAVSMPEVVALIIVVITMFITILLYYRRNIDFKRALLDIAESRRQAESDYVHRSGEDISIAMMYSVASRHPNLTRDAEVKLAQSRCHLHEATFPHLVERDVKRDLLLISRPYTELGCVATMQSLVRDRVQAHCASQGRKIVEPSIVKELGQDFDALRHPQLAIANPALYSFPFLLTWERRHLWGVLPYAVHTKLGLIVRHDHPNIKFLVSLQKRYEKELNELTSAGAQIWINNPMYASWLTTLLISAGNTPSRLLFHADAEPLHVQHRLSTVFSVGAYLHKELLPLACAAITDARTAALYAAQAEEIEVSHLNGPNSIFPADVSSWPRASAIIADLAVIPADVTKSGWTVVRVPHCVYVPIGIGFSVAALPHLSKQWRNDLLAEVGVTLMQSEPELAALGIELDARLWNPRNGGR